MIYVFGKNGTLGRAMCSSLVKNGLDFISYGRDDIDVLNLNLEEFAKNNTFKNDDIIINCIGLLKPKIKDASDTIKINDLFATYLDLISKEKGCFTVNISSDCVFSGNKGQYIETDICDATDLYGITKRLNHLSNSCVIRCSFIGNNENDPTSLLEFARSNKNKMINGYVNCLWNGVTALEVSKFIMELICNVGLRWKGLRHLYGKETVSKFELLSIIDTIYELNMYIYPIKATEISGSKVHNVLDRSLNSIYSSGFIDKSIQQLLIETKYNV